MTTTKILHLFGILILVKFTTIKAEIDCKQDTPLMNFNYCCELSNVLSPELTNKCIDKVFGDMRENVTHQEAPNHPRPCFLACVIEETGILVDNELQLDNLNTYLNEAFNDSDKVEFLSNKFLDCYEQRSEFLLNATDANDTTDCNPQQIESLLGCVNVQAFINCPDYFWINMDKCNILRDYIKQCHSK